MTATYEKIATNTLGSEARTVTFSSVSANYTDLVLILNLKAVSGSSVYPKIAFNSDTAANYSITFITGNGSTATSGRVANSVGYITGYTVESSTEFNFNGIYSIQNYSNTTTFKTTIGRCNNAAGHTEAIVNLWRNTAAINAVSIINDSVDFAIGSTFTLYGIKAE
jgi:hypothetical protein